LHNGWKHYRSSVKERSGSLSQAQLLHILKGYKAARYVINARTNTGFTAAGGDSSLEEFYRVPKAMR